MHARPHVRAPDWRRWEQAAADAWAAEGAKRKHWVLATLSAQPVGPTQEAAAARAAAAVFGRSPVAAARGALRHEFQSVRDAAWSFLSRVPAPLWGLESARAAGRMLRAALRLARSAASSRADAGAQILRLIFVKCVLALGWALPESLPAGPAVRRPAHAATAHGGGGRSLGDMGASGGRLDAIPRADPDALQLRAGLGALPPGTHLDAPQPGADPVAPAAQADVDAVQPRDVHPVYVPPAHLDAAQRRFLRWLLGNLKAVVEEAEWEAPGPAVLRRNFVHGLVMSLRLVWFQALPPITPCPAWAALLQACHMLT